ncbi:MAG: hypothetical protein EON60_06855 [Alphaproteobacteria bacterium]|nr:MAG: hypothetical protein EON60_06855 [Alphaproteobacteria bacterium]
MIRIALIAPVFAILTSLLLTACGSDPDLAGTKGQEILDLQNAHKERAITSEEYEDQKEEVLDR